tara:strand:+ start:1070 stop:1252 length:183 start_codon:yes stop_codon:yes gene_type:complete
MKTKKKTFWSILFFIISSILMLVLNCVAFAFSVAQDIVGGTLDIMIAEDAVRGIKNHFSD